MGFLNKYIIIKIKFVIIDAILQKYSTSLLQKFLKNFICHKFPIEKNDQIVAITTLESEMFEKEKVVRALSLLESTVSFFLFSFSLIQSAFMSTIFNPTWI